MYTLIIGRAFPAEETGMMGIFEFEQASLISRKDNKTVYAFVDSRSVKALRKFNGKEFTKNDVNIIGYHLPIGGLPQMLFDKIKYFYFKKTIKKILKNHGKPEVIHIHFPLLTINNYIWEFLKTLNIPIIVTEHWSKVQKMEIENFRKKLLEKIVREASSFMTVNEKLKEVVLELTNTSKEIVIMPNMISNEFHYKKTEGKRERFRFIAIGRLVAEKRYTELIKKFNKVFVKHKNVELIIIGDGPKRKELQLVIKRLNIEGKVILKGFLSRKEIVKELQEAEAYVSSSSIETFGVPYIEALACGKPIIGKRNGVIEKLLDDVKYGVTYDSIFELEDCLAQIYSNYDEYDYKLLSKLAIMKYGEDSIYEQLKETYNNARKDYNRER